MMVLNGVELMKLGRVEMSTLKISCLMNLLFFFFFLILTLDVCVGMVKAIEKPRSMSFDFSDHYLNRLA